MFDHTFSSWLGTFSDMSHVDAVAKFLSAIPASAFVASSPVFKIESSTSLRDAVRVLNDNNVTGAPVFVDDITSVSSPQLTSA